MVLAKVDMTEWDRLSELEKGVILDLKDNGPDCAKFLSRRLRIELGQCMNVLAIMEDKGWLERVKGTFLFKPGLRRPKHMNHTYYQLTRDAKKELRFLARKRKL